jgi:hypothetical protein
MAEFPLDPKVLFFISSTAILLFYLYLQLSKMLLASVDLGCSEEVDFTPSAFN